MEPKLTWNFFRTYREQQIEGEEQVFDDFHRTLHLEKGGSLSVPNQHCKTALG